MRGLVPYAWRSLVARPARTLLTASGIAIGVAVLVAALAVDTGFDASVDRTVAALVGRADLRVGAFAETGLSDRTLAAVDAVPVFGALLDQVDALNTEAAALPRVTRDRRLRIEVAVILGLSRRLAARLRRGDPVAGRVRLRKSDAIGAVLSALRFAP